MTTAGPSTGSAAETGRDRLSGELAGVPLGRQLGEQVQPGRDAADLDLGEPLGQRADQGVAAGAVFAPHPAQVPVVGAGGDEMGQRVLVEHR